MKKSYDDEHVKHLMKEIVTLKNEKSESAWGFIELVL